MINKIIAAFNSNNKTGVIGAKEFIMNEFDKKRLTYKTPNNFILQEMIERFSLSLTDYRFIGGTMFWVRHSIIKSFFEINSPLECRSRLEE